MIDDNKRRILHELWSTEQDDFCSTAWRADLTEEEEALVNSWDDQFPDTPEDVWDEMTSDDFALFEFSSRI